MKALCVGQSIYSFNILVDKMPVEGTTNVFSEVVEGGAGSAANVAFLLGKYQNDSYLASVIGDDTFGNLLKKELEKVGVHTEYMETAYDKRTSLDMTFISQTTKLKMVNNISKEKLLMKKSDFQMDPDVVYVDGFDYGASLAALNKYNSKITVIGAKKPNKEIYELCKYCKYIIATQEFAQWVTGMRIDFDNPATLVDVYSALINKFVNKTIIITINNRGCLYIKDNQIKVMPGLNINLIDDSGSGDFFRGAFIHYLMQENDIEKAITFANIAAGIACTKMGTRAAVPEISDVMVYFNQKYGAIDNAAMVQNANTQPVQNPAPASLNQPVQPAQNTAPVNNETNNPNQTGA